MRLPRPFSSPFLLLLLLLPIITSKAQQLTPCDTTPAERLAITHKALSVLEEDYEIIPGKLSFPNFAQPAGRYGLVSFDGNVVNPKGLCAITDGVQTPYGKGLCNYTYTLGPRDGVVGLFCTPPPVKYFSIRSYVGFRFRPEAWLPAVELGDADNNLVINTTDPTTPYCKTSLFLSTGDGITAAQAKHAFHSQGGWPLEAMNLDVVSTEKAYFRDFSRPWIVDRSDGFVINYRVSQPLDKGEVESYFLSTFPFYLLRYKEKKEEQEKHSLFASSSSTTTTTKPMLRPSSPPLNHTHTHKHTHPTQPRLPLTTPPLRPRGTGENEEHLRPALQQLEETIITYMQTSRGAKLVTKWPMSHVVPDYTKCLTDPHYYPIASSIPEWNQPGLATCGFFSNDCLYTFLALPDEGKIDYGDLVFPKNRSFVLLGVNQVRQEKVVYSNIFMTSVLEPQHPGRTVNYSAEVLEGSASWYLPDVEDAKELFAVTLTRDNCNMRPPASHTHTYTHTHTHLGGEKEPFCTTVPEQVLNTTEFVYVVERKYLQPATKVGPAPEEVIEPLVLVFETPGIEEEEERWSEEA